jgi:hypothetical protein
MIRPTSWSESIYINMILTLIKTEKYNANSNMMISKHDKKWNEMINALNKML